MRELSFQVLFVLFMSFNALCSKMPDCSAKLDLHLAKNMMEMEELAHPKCVALEIEKIKNKRYPDIKKWKRAYNLLKMSDRLPKSWLAFHQASSFLFNIKSDLTSYDISWAFIEDKANREALVSFLKKQPMLKEEVFSLERSAGATRALNAFFPFSHIL